MSLVLLNSYDQVIHAEMAKSYLASHGIDCEIHDAHIISTQWFYSNIVGGVKLKVFEADFKKAKELLQNLPDELHENEFQGPECPNCSSNQTEVIERKQGLRRLLFLSWIIIPGFTLPLQQSTDWSCSKCNHKWTTKEAPRLMAVIGQSLISITILSSLAYYIYFKYL